MSCSDPEAFIKAYRKRCARWFLIKPRRNCGCTPAEVAAVEADQGVPLPAIYRFFLLEMGQAYGLSLSGELFYFPEIIGIRRRCEEDVADFDTCFRLPSDAVVFGSYESEYHYVRASEGDDPPVYHWDPGLDEAEVIYPSFSAFLDALFVGIRSYHWFF